MKKFPFKFQFFNSTGFLSLKSVQENIFSTTQSYLEDMHELNDFWLDLVHEGQDYSVNIYLADDNNQYRCTVYPLLSNSDGTYSTDCSTIICSSDIKLIMEQVNATVTIQLHSSDDLLKNLGKNIQVLRKVKGLSQQEFANQLGLHRTYIGMIERSERHPSVICVYKIAQLLNVSVEMLLTGKDK